MGTGSGKRRIDEDSAKDVKSPLDLPQLSEQQLKVVDAQVKRELDILCCASMLTPIAVHERAEIAVDVATNKILQTAYQKRREAVKALPRFWGTALAQHDQLAVLISGQDDMKALSHLTDLWVEHGSTEHRAFTIFFEFSENPYFSDTVLKKEYKYTPPEGTPAVGTGVDANGVSDAQAAFEWESHVTPQAIKINWKDDAHNLAKLFPRVANPEDPEDIEEFGSFFNFFEQASDDGNIGPIIVQDVYPDVLRLYLGEGRMLSDEEIDSEDDDESDDEDDEIDLEQPRRKKAKQA
ncbi:hypothetical protein FRC09_006459 [Ceratobasidium sp. 395]|nr:hypothetical protein FRC09_006459 [Ceratobasidium sp. 395]